MQQPSDGYYWFSFFGATYLFPSLPTVMVHINSTLNAWQSTEGGNLCGEWNIVVRASLIHDHIKDSKEVAIPVSFSIPYTGRTKGRVSEKEALKHADRYLRQLLRKTFSNPRDAILEMIVGEGVTEEKIKKLFRQPRTPMVDEN